MFRYTLWPILLTLGLFACPTIPGMVTVCFNKPGIYIAPIPQSSLDRLAQKLGIKKIRLTEEHNITCLTLQEPLRTAVLFPEDFSDGSRFSLGTRTLPNEEMGKRMQELLETLRQNGFVEGLGTDDLKKIVSLSKGGKILFYLPQKCAERSDEEGWRSESNNVRIRFDTRNCPRIEILR